MGGCRRRPLLWAPGGSSKEPPSPPPGSSTSSRQQTTLTDLWQCASTGLRGHAGSGAPAACQHGAMGEWRRRATAGHPHRGSAQGGAGPRKPFGLDRWPAAFPSARRTTHSSPLLSGVCPGATFLQGGPTVYRSGSQGKGGWGYAGTEGGWEEEGEGGSGAARARQRAWGCWGGGVCWCWGCCCGGCRHCCCCWCKWEGPCSEQAAAAVPPAAAAAGAGGGAKRWCWCWCCWG